jgi:hypothetical protein
MAYDSPRQATRRANLLRLLDEPAIGSAANLARLIGQPNMKTHFSAIKAGRRGIGDDLAASIEIAAQKPPGWLDWVHPIARETDPRAYVAQLLSQSLVSHMPPLLSLEALMSSERVPESFCTQLHDDALAPELPKGTEVVWSTRRQVQPGRYLLLRDSHGQVHARLCQQGRTPGHWLGTPLSPAYVVFDSTEPGLQVLAVYKGRLEPDDA